MRRAAATRGLTVIKTPGGHRRYLAAEINASCGEKAASCVCIEPAWHPRRVPHLCRCGGSWRGTFSEGRFEVVEWPAHIQVDGVR